MLACTFGDCRESRTVHGFLWTIRPGKADEEFRLADAAVISSILKEARKFDDVPPFVYPCGCPEDRMELQEDEWER